MMEKLRTAANSVVIKIIFGIIILSFVLTGVGGYLVGGTKDYAAKVNGDKIDIGNFEQAVQSERIRLQEQLGDQFSALAGNEDYIKQMRHQVLNRMVDDTLLDQYAVKLGLAVSDEMVEQRILTFPDFRTNDKFDNAKYQNIIARMGLTPDRYAQYIRQQILSQQLLQGYVATDFRLPAETQAIAALVLQSRDIRLAQINIKALESKQTVTDAELQAYYKNNASSFIAPERIKVSYIELDATKFSDQAAVTPEDISNYYTENKDSFSQVEQRHYRIIQVKTEADAKAVLKSQSEGVDFGELVKSNSTDAISRNADGYLDWVDAASTPDEILQAKLTEKGQVSAPIKFNNQFVIIQLADIKPRLTKPLSDVQAEIANKLKQDKALDAYYAAQQKLSKGATDDNESLQTAEEAVNMKAVESDWFTRDKAPAALDYPQLVQAIFSGKLFDTKGQALGNSDVINVEGDRAFVVRVTGYEPEKTKAFDLVRADIEMLVKRSKAEADARAQGQKLLAALNSGKGDAAMTEAGLAFGEKQVLTRESTDRQLVDSVFALPHPAKDKSTYGVAQDSQDNIVLISLDAVNQGKLKDDEVKLFAEQLQKGNNGIVFDALLSTLRKEAKIDVGDVLAQ